ncbi:MAG: Asp-tRNA(Asn)/Glu-tRNA(Gln) amidotransferase GatCAB subunit A [Bacteroidetes bacterium]|nr:MAG: Asp-tRNA(Asn)/Glu-tRNA(Gln) amidotransferase GatCAB subunit A [Bacteroidota bacterium]PTM14730.1 MAG: Asp-tRNA(Asn)/Glu-tRNA(Gln) amidotransferase GatCAB subunit A [Bacteroidota bacterium]
MPQFTHLAEVQAQLQAGSLTTQALVDAYLARIAATADLNIYVEVWADEARAAARQQDQRRAAGEPLGRLAGLVVSIKDVICYKDHQVTAGSRILQGFRSLFSATAVERMLAEDAILIGRTNCDEFAMGSTNETSVYGPTRNAADPTRIPGGSSGAAAVSVQADTCLMALGSDTGGSVRQPAAFCGVVGFKPSYGRISRHGLLAYGSSFDQIGVLAHNVTDTALLLEIMAGADEFDGSASAAPVPAYSQSAAWNKPARIAYLRAALEHPGLDVEVRENAGQFLDQLRAAGHTVTAVDFELLDYIIPAYYVLTTAEASSNLSRYDGIRFGYRNQEATSLLETYQKSRTEGFGTEVKRRIMLGTFVLSSGYYDAYYARAQKVRRLIVDRLEAIFSGHDFIFLPTSPTPAWPLGESLSDPVAMYLSDIYTVAANMAGIPAISIPSGIHATTQMPLGVQLMAPAFAEEDLLAFAASLPVPG